MEEFDFEKFLIAYLKHGIWELFSKYWFAFLLLLVLLAGASVPVIRKIPYRYNVKAILKMAKLEKRIFKSTILQSPNSIAQESSTENAIGYSAKDLKIILKTKYLSRRSGIKKITDRGPFVSGIDIPKKSELLIINAEGEDVESTEELVRSIINVLKGEYAKQETLVRKEITQRLMILEKDHKDLIQAIKRIDDAEKKYGFSPVLVSRRNEVVLNETRLRYMIFDVKSQLSPNNMHNFKVIAFSSTPYPVTTRHLYFFIGAGFIAFIIVMIILFISGGIRFAYLSKKKLL